MEWTAPCRPGERVRPLGIAVTGLVCSRVGVFG